MAQDLIDIDESDHLLAAGAFKRITTKSALALETMVDRLAIKGIDHQTPVPDVLNIANFMAKVSSAPEQSKRDLPEGGGATGPRITLIIGDQATSATGRLFEGDSEERALSGVEGPDQMPEGEDIFDEEWGL